MANVGDSLNAPLHEWITGKPWPKHAKYLGVGTVLRDCEGHSVWGTGYDGFRHLNRKRGKVCAVRGPMTRKALLHYGWECPEIYGDLGILLPKFLPLEVEKKHAVGYVPHFKDMRQSIQGWHRVSPRTDDVEAFLRDLLSCEVIVSQSLHGLIFADAYGIPRVWKALTHRREYEPDKEWTDRWHQDEAWQFKYDDYHASIGVKCVPSNDINDARLCPIPEGMADKLLEVCPWT